MRHDQVIWALIMDGARGQVFDLTLSPLRLTARTDGHFEGSRLTTRELTSDRPGHGHESVGTSRHALEPRTDAHRHAEETFAAGIAKSLAKSGDLGAFDQLILVAPPRALGDLRAHLPKRLRDKKVKLEIAGDWTKLTSHEAAKHLRPHLLDSGFKSAAIE